MSPRLSDSETHALPTSARGLCLCSVQEDVLCGPWGHIPSVSCCVSAAPDTDSPVCFERGSPCCVRFVTGPFLFGFDPASFAGALASFARCDVHPARQEHANVKENGRNLSESIRKEQMGEMLKDHSDGLEVCSLLLSVSLWNQMKLTSATFVALADTFS